MTAPPPCRCWAACALAVMLPGHGSSGLETLYKNSGSARYLLSGAWIALPPPLRHRLVVGEVEAPWSLHTSPPQKPPRPRRSRCRLSGPPTLVDSIQKAVGSHRWPKPAAGGWCSGACRADSRFKRTRVDLLALCATVTRLQNPLLFDGDTIKLEPVAQEDASNSAKLAVTTWSDADHRQT